MCPENNHFEMQNNKWKLQMDTSKLSSLKIERKFARHLYLVSKLKKMWEFL